MIMIGWTSVSTRPEADSLARGLIEARLAACVQIDGPITSHFVWDGAAQESQEFRLCVKFQIARAHDVQKWILAHHPYEVPEWIACRAEIVSEKYLSWMEANSST